MRTIGSAGLEPIVVPCLAAGGALPPGRPTTKIGRLLAGSGVVLMPESQAVFPHLQMARAGLGPAPLIDRGLLRSADTRSAAALRRQGSRGLGMRAMEARAARYGQRRINGGAGGLAPSDRNRCYSASNSALAAASSLSFSSPTSGYFKSSDAIASITAAATTRRVNHLLSAGTTYHGASSVAV